MKPTHKRHPEPEMITSCHVEGIRDHSPRSSKPTFRETTYAKENVLTINPQTYTQIHTPTVVQEGGGVDGTPPRSF